jgi:hypothetical protein
MDAGVVVAAEASPLLLLAHDTSSLALVGIRERAVLIDSLASSLMRRFRVDSLLSS